MVNVTAQAIIEIAKLLDKDIPSSKLADVKQLLDAIDQPRLKAEEEGSLTYEIWDKTTPINGVDAETVLKRDDVDENSEIYLIKDVTGKVIYFQPHEPQIVGFKKMNKTDIKVVADNHRKVIANERVNVRVVNEVLNKLGI